MKALRRTNAPCTRSRFAEVSEGVTALADSRLGKRTLRTHTVEFKPATALTPRDLAGARARVTEQLGGPDALTQRLTAIKQDIAAM